MASLTRWTWVWVNSRSWWWTGRPGVLQFMGSQRVRHDWVTELNWTDSVSWWRLSVGWSHNMRLLQKLSSFISLEGCVAASCLCSHCSSVTYLAVETWEIVAITALCTSSSHLSYLIYLRRRQWHPTPILLPGKSHEQRSLVGCRLWGHTESDTTEAT